MMTAMWTYEGNRPRPGTIWVAGRAANGNGAEGHQDGPRVGNAGNANMRAFYMGKDGWNEGRGELGLLFRQ